MEKRVHDFDSKKTCMIANASLSLAEPQVMESAPKPYMFTRSTPNRAKPRTISISTMRESGATGPTVTRLNAGPWRMVWPIIGREAYMNGTARINESRGLSGDPRVWWRNIRVSAGRCGQCCEPNGDRSTATEGL